jgi:hypothetical protein
VALHRRIADDWTIDAAADLIKDRTAVPLTGWQQLAQTFLTCLEGPRPASR